MAAGPIAEGVQVRVSYKAYTLGQMTSNQEAVSTTDPGTGAGYQLRRVESSLELKKSGFKSNEIRPDRQVADFRHGARSVTGAISGELSPATYMDFFEAVSRGTRVSRGAVSLTTGNVTSLTPSNTLSAFTAGTGNPVSIGVQIGDILRSSTFAVTTANNNQNFIVTGFSGTNNVQVNVTPPPTSGAADTGFTSFAATGYAVSPPTSAASFVSRKFAIEHYYPDISLAKLFTECRAGGFSLNLPASGLATAQFDFTGRDMEQYTASTPVVAPFFSAPGAATTTNLLDSVQGVLRVGGTIIGIATGVTMKVDLKASTQAVVGQSFAPDVFLGRYDCTGQLTALLQDGVLISDFINETEIDLLLYLSTKNTGDTGLEGVFAPAMTMYLPRIKFTGASNPARGEAGQLITLPFQALLYSGATPGAPNSTLLITDTEAGATGP